MYQQFPYKFNLFVAFYVIKSMNLYICVLIFFSMNIKVTAHQFMLIQSLNDIFFSYRKTNHDVFVCMFVYEKKCTCDKGSSSSSSSSCTMLIATLNNRTELSTWNESIIFHRLSITLNIPESNHVNIQSNKN